MESGGMISDEASNGNHALRNDVLLRLLEHFRSQYHHQRDTLTSWLKYYVTIIGAPIPLFLSFLTRTDLFIPFLDVSRRVYLIAIALFFAVLGVLFFAIFLRQRFNAWNFMMLRIEPLEETLWSLGQVKNPRDYSLFPYHRFGADSWLGVVYAFVNSVWLGIAICYLLSGPFSIETILISIAYILLSFIIHIGFLLRAYGRKKL